MLRLVEARQEEPGRSAPFAACPLTTEDVLNVNLASKGENRRHCHWPREVIEKFLAAEVITAGKEFGNSAQITNCARLQFFLLSIASLRKYLRKRSETVLRAIN